TGEETMEVVMERDSSLEVVHTYGWYMRKYIKDAKEAGGIPIVLSPVPRNMWDEAGNVLRASGDYGKWASDVAAEENAYFIDLNGIIAVKYEVLGEEEVTRRYFLTDHTHTNLVGARVNAAAVVEGLRMIPDCPLNKYLTE
ncbi:MAG: rhamnogalacturonan acetylesterase, partial [Bacteroidales bacterium]|nr:rhamnogalacturonan acetylesterase [Bacteroidales bacterium]